MLALALLASCNSSGSDEPSPLIGKAEILTSGQATLSSVSIPNGSNVTSWTGFTIQFTGDENGGTYTTNAEADLYQTAVWKKSGTWEFGDDEGTVIIRDGNTTEPISVKNLSETAVEMEFTMTTALSSGRVNVVEGPWVFKFNF